MRVIVTKMKNNVPFWFEIFGHAPNEKLCAVFSVVKHILETGLRDYYHASCLVNESNGDFRIGVQKKDAWNNPEFLALIGDILKGLCEDNSIDFTEEQDDD